VAHGLDVGWTRADMGGRLKIGYTSSNDLIAWTPQRPIFVMDNEPEARNAWAPEAVGTPVAKSGRCSGPAPFPAALPRAMPAATAATPSHLRHHHHGLADVFAIAPVVRPGLQLHRCHRDASRQTLVMVFKDERKTPLVKRLRLAFADSPRGPWKTSASPLPAIGWRARRWRESGRSG